MTEFHQKSEKTTNLNQVFQGFHENANFLQRLLGSETALELKLEENLGAIKAKPEEVEEIITRLVILVREPLKMAGKMTIQVENNIKGVCLMVSNNEAGMPEETADLEENLKAVTELIKRIGGILTAEQDGKYLAYLPH